MADGAPPLDGHADLGRVQIHLQVRNAIEQIGGAFNGGAVDSILDGELFEGRPLHDGLADDGVRPCDGIALRVQSRGETVVPHGAVPAAGEIILAGPDNFDGGLGNFGDVDSLNNEVGCRVGATAEAATEQCGVDFDFFRGQAGGFGGVGAVDGFELRAGPDFASVGAQIHDAIERLHHGVGEVGDVVFGGDGFCGACQSGGRVTDFFCDVSGSRGLSGKIGEHLRGREFCVFAVVPGDFYFFTGELCGPKTIRDDGNSGRNLFDSADSGNLERFGGVETYEFAAKHRRSCDEGKHHARQTNVEAELRAAVDFGRGVETTYRFSNQGELLWIFQRNVCRWFQLRSGVGERTVGSFLSGSGVNHHSFFDATFR